jgi:transcriptional regulator with XRE-family HTH domain
MIASMEKWNDRLVYALKVRKKTQADLIRVTGAKGSSVNEWVSGITKNMKASNAIKVCNFLRINIDWFLHKKGPSGLEEENGAPVFLTKEQREILSLAEHMEPEARGKWIAIGSSLPSLNPTDKAVDNKQPQPIELPKEKDNPARRIGEINYEGATDYEHVEEQEIHRRRKND